MSWLDAHECFVMDIVVRDRMEDLRSTIDVATAPTEATVATTGAVPDIAPRPDGMLTPSIGSPNSVASSNAFS